jgi:NAD(P)-dependent dehydrogenase (short-subunit alcohol dehydrogenase family)
MAFDAVVAAVVREFGRLDIVLESAGISHRLNFLDADAETWDRIIAVTLSGMFHARRDADRAYAPQLRRPRGTACDRGGDPARPTRPARRPRRRGAVSRLRRVALGNRQHGNSGRRLSGDLTRRE